MNLFNKIEKNINQIRQSINESYKQNILLKNKLKWDKLCASLDLIEDTVLAIKYYIYYKFPSNYEGKYLYIYGLLQALFLQQDAVNGINLSLLDKDIDFKNKYPDLFKIREIRNDILHSVGRKIKKHSVFIHLSRISIEKYSFDYITYSDDPEKDGELRSVNIKEIILSQNQCIENILILITKKLKEEFSDYINMHKKIKMIDIFKNISYARAKLLTKDLNHKYWRPYHLKIIRTTINDFKKEISKRYLSWEDVSYSYTIKAIDQLLDIIEKKLPTLGIDISEIDYFLIEHVFCKIKELEKIAEEIDEFFENNGNFKIKQNNQVNNIRIRFVKNKNSK